MTHSITNSATVFPDHESQSTSDSGLSAFALGMSLSTFLVITYVVCTVFDLWLPQYAMNASWGVFLPGFVWLSWPSFFLGLAETALYGWYIALIFAPLYNFFIGRNR